MNYALPLLLLCLFLAPASAPLYGQADAVTTDANLYRSTDGGFSWHPFTEGLPDGTSSNIVLEDNGQLLMATDNAGVYELYPGSDTWQPLNKGLPAKLYISTMAKRGNRIVIGTGRGKLYISSDGGQNWTFHEPETYGAVFHSIIFHGDLLLAGTDNGVYRSTDNGKNWQATDDMVQVNDMTAFKGRLYAARRDGILVSDDDGKTWSYVFTQVAVRRLLIDKDKLYGINLSNEILRSHNGTTWEKPLIGLPGNHRNLPATLWWGYSPKLPRELPVRGITETSRGWFLGLAAGC